jgi:hypothetical protein
MGGKNPNVAISSLIPAVSIVPDEFVMATTHPPKKKKKENRNETKETTKTWKKNKTPKHGICSHTVVHPMRVLPPRFDSREAQELKFSFPLLCSLSPRCRHLRRTHTHRSTPRCSKSAQRLGRSQSWHVGFSGTAKGRINANNTDDGKTRRVVVLCVL